jgi:hypothetical protein
MPRSSIRPATISLALSSTVHIVEPSRVEGHTRDSRACIGVSGPGKTPRAAFARTPIFSRNNCPTCGDTSTTIVE